MVNYKYRYIILAVVVALLYSSAANAGLNDAFTKVLEFIRSDFLRTVAMLAILAVLLTAMWTQVIDWRKGGIVIFVIGVAFSVTDVLEFVKG